MKQIIKNYLYNSSYQLLVIIIPLITAPYLSRVIGAEGIGKYSYTFSIAYYFEMFIILGLNNYGSRTVATVQGNKGKLSYTFWSLYYMQLFCGFICLTAYGIYVFFISKDQLASLLLLPFVISGFFDINWFFNGIEKFKVTVVRNSIVKILATIFIFVFVKSGNDIYIYIIIMALSFLFSQVILWPFLFKEIDLTKVQFKDIVMHIKPNSILFIAVLAVSLYKYMGKIMLGAIVNEAEVGFYENAEKILQIPVNLVSSLGIVMIPRMSNLFASNNNDDHKEDLIFLSVIFVVFLSTSLCMGIMAISDTFVPVFYGEGFEKSVLLLQILMPSCIFMAFANVIRTQYLIPTKKDNIFIYTIILGAVVNFVANIILIPKYLSQGAAIGTLLAEISVCVLQAFFVRNHLPVKKYIISSSPFILSGMIMYIGVQNVQLPIENDVLVVIIKVVLGACFYIIALGFMILIFRKTFSEIRRIIKK